MNIPQTVSKAATRLRQQRNTVRQRFGPSVEDVEILTQAQQLQRFLDMDFGELAALRMKRGNESVDKYIKTQMRNLLRSQRQWQ